MATPSQSITTVNGRRCTRSRARTAATTSQAATSTQITSSTTTTSQDAPQIQTSTAQTSSNPPPPPSSQPPPPPPPPPVSSAPAPSADQAAQPTADGTTAPTDAVAGTSSTGTLSTVLISSSARVEPLALPSSDPATAGLEQPPAAQASVEVPLQIPVVSAAPSTSPTPTTPSPISTVPNPIPTNPTPTSTTPSPIPTSSDSISTAVPSSLVEASEAPPLFTASPASDPPASVDPNSAIPLESGTNLPSSILGPTVARPRPTASPADGPAGIIAPDQGSSNDDGPLTLSRNGNIGGILGGVFGGIAALALISALLFLCLRKRKSQPVRWNEKRQEYPSFLDKLKTIPTELGAFVAKLRGSQNQSARNTYQRHVPKASVDSVYSRDSNGRIRSNSEPQGVKRAGSSGSMSSRKSDRNVLRKKPSSVSAYRFPDIAEDTGSPNPFADPQQMRPLLLLNPDPRSTPGTPQMPAATAEPPEPRDPFASVYDPPPAAPTWERGPANTHQRAMSSASGQSSLPTWSLYATDNPFRDPPNAPPLPNQAVLPQHQRRRSSMALPNFKPATAFDANSTFATRDSGMYFGEPGPSRPATNMFTPVTPARRTIRQSDPFDLDRPEVLGFGGISRQPTRNKRTSNTSNWYTAGAGAPNNPPLPRAM
ncbi:hypothetical protein yc1106_07330 [Curvularia clavata]|uniref:Uncharacterized protein n=1 Tax=Curvularia clavata TaxID=95742 RepID=A0A9Q8ZDA4_CURCL|nr:hypothetical protein yc1106_07330 [Curvularia clavata]